MQPDKNFINYQITKLEQLLLKKRSYYRVDLHLHTNYSVDGLQTVEQAIENAKKMRFDIISIADHDTISAYDEIVDSKLFRGEEVPIIIPGVEFTVSYPAYEGRCHVLKYFYDANDKRILNLISENKSAFNNRVNIWFKRIGENKCLNFYTNMFGITFSIDDYWKFIKKKEETVPDYPTIVEYIYSQLCKYEISIWDVYNKAVAFNELDPCITRKLKKTAALKRFYDKYSNKEISTNYRKLKPILAPLGIDDDDFPEYESSGSLSVNEYGQIPILKLINSGINVLAHPDIKKINCIDELLEVSCIAGVEVNWHNQQYANNLIYKRAKDVSALITRGSDKHSYKSEEYDDLGFYDMSYEELRAFVWRIKQFC